MKHILARSRRQKKASQDSRVPRRWKKEQAQTLSAPTRVLLTRWGKFPPSESGSLSRSLWDMTAAETTRQRAAEVASEMRA